MANKKSAMKALRQSKKLHDRNMKVKNNIKWLSKKASQAIAAKSEDAKELVKKLEKFLDKAVQKSILPENTGRRRKSRIMQKFNAAFGVKKS